MKALKTSKGAKSGGRPKETKKLVNVKKYLPWMKRVAAYQIVYSQLDELEAFYSSNPFAASDLRNRIAQIKEDISKIKI